MALLETLNVTKSFAPGETAVADVSLAVHEGEIVCLLGPSGCGKTTLLRLIAGLETPDAGEVWFDGRNIGRTPPHEREFGMMFQDFALFPHLNVYKNVAFGLEMHKQTPAQIAARVADMLDLVDLAGFAQRDVAQLSGGEQQRVALARALAPRPRLLMLDEPLGALDRALRERLMLEVRAILRRVGVTAVYVTHDQTEAFAIADRIAVMQAGQIVQIDRPETVYRRPATPFVARFLGFHNVLDGVVVDGVLVETAVGKLRLPHPVPAGPVTLLLRPEGSRLAPPEDEAGENALRARVTAVSFRGKFYQVWFAVAGPGGAETTLMFEWPAHPALRVGDQARLAIDPAAILSFAA